MDNRWRKTKIAKIYSPLCTVCQYMKKNRTYTTDVLLCTLFEPKGAESLAGVNVRYREPVQYQSLLMHVRRHMRPALSEWRRIYKLNERTAIQKKEDRAKEILASTMTVVESPAKSYSAHEDALDLIIEKGTDAVRRGELKVTGAILNQAIRTKAEIENKNKDRKLDAMKTLFSGMGPNESQS